MNISIIIPLFNEEKQIRSLWSNLMMLEAAEIIFVDGGSMDSTLEILNRQIQKYKKESKEVLSIKKHDVRVLISKKKGRANQMNYGASRATGDILWFLHADSKVPKTSIRDIISALKYAEAGCFRLRFLPNSWLMTCCGYLSGFRVMTRKIMFGDQGIFIYKNFFEELGGFSDMPIMEDYEFSLRIKKLNKAIKMTNSVLFTSARRFVQNGAIKTMIQMQKLQWKYRQGEDIEQIYKEYQDIR